jgi:hypothetical protein
MDDRRRFWRRQTLGLIHAFLLSLLLVAAPVAMRLSPIENVDSPYFDSQYALRLGLIIGGLVAAATSFCLVIWESFRRDWSGRDLIVKMSLASCSFSLGWAIFPYWVSGMRHTDSRLAAIVFQRDVLGSGFWGVWEMVTLLILFACLTLLQIIIIVNFDLLVRTRPWRQGLAALTCLALSVVGFAFAPNYWHWFLD